MNEYLRAKKTKGEGHYIFLGELANRGGEKESGLAREGWGMEKRERKSLEYICIFDI